MLKVRPAYKVTMA